jgi:isoleucyl-tRNA synthetase
LQYSAITNVEGLGEVWVGVSKADGEKCERCWNYSKKVGNFRDHAKLCERCHPIIVDMSQREENLATV